MSRLFNNEYFNELDKLQEITTEEAIKNFKSKSGLTRYEILDIKDQKQIKLREESKKWKLKLY